MITALQQRVSELISKVYCLWIQDANSAYLKKSLTAKTHTSLQEDRDMADLHFSLWEVDLRDDMDTELNKHLHCNFYTSLIVRLILQHLSDLWNVTGKHYICFQLALNLNFFERKNIYWCFIL